jgi:hypothetical protein
MKRPASFKVLLFLISPSLGPRGESLLLTKTQFVYLHFVLAQYLNRSFNREIALILCDIYDPKLDDSYLLSLTPPGVLLPLFKYGSPARKILHTCYFYAQVLLMVQVKHHCFICSHSLLNLFYQSSPIHLYVSRRLDFSDRVMKIWCK